MGFFKRAKRTLRGCRPSSSLRIVLFPDDQFCINLFGFLFPLPFMDRWVRGSNDMLVGWGVYFFQSAIVFCWGTKTKFIYMPWIWDHCVTEVRRADGTWVRKTYEWCDEEPDGRETQSFDYTYRCDSGKIQNVTAMVYVERRTLWWKWFRWLGFPWKRHQSIAVSFSDEVGDAAGSWKGGVIGTGWDMLPGETMEQTLRRMEAERRFR